MPTLAIRARFPLGFYQGHVDAGRPSPAPDTARLHAALVHAAGTGSTAVVQEGRLTPSAEALAALRWLEEHPPAALKLPTETVKGPTWVDSFRNEGVLTKTGAPKLAHRHHPLGVPIRDHVGWGWDEEVPEPVKEVLERLCEDVSCLGESESAVVLELADFEPTHLRGEQHGPFVKGGVQVRTPATGRVDALEAAHQATLGKRPTAAQDRHSWNQEPNAVLPTDGGLEQLNYRAIDAPTPDLPWTSAIALVPSGPVAVAHRVRWCVALHRALISRLGDAAPPIVTGNYPAGAGKPSNRVAIQYASGPTLYPELRSGAFLVMAPADVPPEDLLAIEGALSRITRLYRTRDQYLDLLVHGPVDTERFWLPPTEGMTRRWEPIPAMVPEMRRGSRSNGLTVADAVMVSVGHVFRDQLRLGRERGTDRYRAIAEQVRGWGVGLRDVHNVADSRMERYVHRLPRDLVTQPVRAQLSLAGLAGDQSLLAVGQSRHLGGGLLHPIDSATDQEA